jgi:carbon monoxide dehydrogenase subunit G
VADQARSSIEIAAPPAAVMSVIADLEAYPQWSTAIRSVTVDETGPDGRAAQGTFTLDAGVLKDTYTLAYDWDGDTAVSWHLVSGKAIKAQDGSYRLSPSGDGTEVTYELSVELAIPMLGMFKRKAEKVIIDTALKGLKRRVEGH